MTNTSSADIENDFYSLPPIPLALVEVTPLHTVSSIFLPAGRRRKSLSGSNGEEALLSSSSSSSSYCKNGRTSSASSSLSSPLVKMQLQRMCLGIVWDDDNKGHRIDERRSGSSSDGVNGNKQGCVCHGAKETEEESGRLVKVTTEEKSEGRCHERHASNTDDNQNINGGRIRAAVSGGNMYHRSLFNIQLALSNDANDTFRCKERRHLGDTSAPKDQGNDSVNGTNNGDGINSSNHCALIQEKPGDNHNESSNHSSEEMVPVIKIKSDDPIDISDGVPCWVRGYLDPLSVIYATNTQPPSKVRRSRYHSVAVTDGTMVRILPPTVASSVTRFSQSLFQTREESDQRYYATILHNQPPLSLLDALSGELPIQSLDDNNNNNNDGAARDDDDADSMVLSCHDRETIQALTIRMATLLSNTVQIGTTMDAIRLYKKRVNTSCRMRNSIERLCQSSSSSSSLSKEHHDGSLGWRKQEKIKQNSTQEKLNGCDNCASLVVNNENGNDDNKASSSTVGPDVGTSGVFKDNRSNAGTEAYSHPQQQDTTNHDSRKHELKHSSPPTQGKIINDDDDDITMTCQQGIPSLLREGALTVHDPIHGSGKTRLVCAIARRILHCHAVHVINPGVLFAKYGVDADSALESILHGLVLSGAVQGGGGGRRGGGKRLSEGRLGKDGDEDGTAGGKVCIVLDHLDTFLPPAMSGRRGGMAGDPSLPVLNAIASYLAKLTYSLKQRSEFPYPAKNPLYNLGGKNGFVLPVSLCIVGVVTCDDDGGRKMGQMQSGAASVGLTNVLDVLGGGRYRLPVPSAKTRLVAFQRAFDELHLTLNKEAMEELPLLAASAVNARGTGFRRVAKRLREIVMERTDQRLTESGSHTLMVNVMDIGKAMHILRTKSSLAEVSFVKSCSENYAASTSNDQSITGKVETSDIFASVGGNTKAKTALEDALALDPEQRRILAVFGLSPPTGVLLYGPPGNGKTLLARATSQALKSERSKGGGLIGVGGAFVSLRASDIVRAEVGNSEKMVVSAFETARSNAPSVVFIDEFQALFTERSRSGSGRLASTLLQCMDDIARWRDADAAAVDDKEASVQSAIGSIGETTPSSRVVVLGATNAPWMIDKAFLRPGRFDRVVHIGLPNLKERESILRVHVSRMKLNGDKTVVDTVCETMGLQCEGFSGADLAALCRAAAVRCLAEAKQTSGVEIRHFSDAIRENDVSRSSSSELVKRLLQWRP